MKKILAILITIFLMASALCVTAFAASDVLTISAIVKGKPVVIDSYDNFKDGWNAAMEIAGDNDEMGNNGYERIVVDLLTDWEANDDGQFSDDWIGGDGFKNDTILIPAEARVTLNLNGHTIDRGLTKDEDDGEVIFINDDADVIINNGTITGGFSNSEGGGLYIEGGANVTLNNVNLTGNAVKGDDGAAIYMYGGSTLTMNGGSVSNNCVGGKYVVVNNIVPYGTICAKDSTVILKNVTIDGNYTKSYSARGLAIYADGSSVTMENCTVSNNATKESVTADIIYADDSSLTITNTNFIDNNTLEPPEKVSGLTPRLFYLEDSDLTMTGGSVAGNGGKELFYFYGSEADMTGVTITYNNAVVVRVRNGAEVVNMTDCILDQNRCTLDYNAEAFQITKEGELVMTDCSLGNSTFDNKKYVTFVTTSASKEEALIGVSGLLGDGTTAFTEYYKSIEQGWGFAMTKASSGDYDRIVVDFYVDWTPLDAVHISENARVAINLNGHTINRQLSNARESGSVMFIGRSADVIINNGTISGGFSTNTAGGIHVNGFADVTLNDVCISGNGSDGSGAGIALYDYSSLTMNGGSLTENRVGGSGTLYTNRGAWAVLNNVTINNNYSVSEWSEGVALASSDGAILLYNCVVSGNGIAGENATGTLSIVHGYTGRFTFENTDFINNASDDVNRSDKSTYLFYISQAGLTMKGGNITNNHPSEIFSFNNAGGSIEGVTITDNSARIFTIYNYGDRKVTVKECTFNNNKSARNLPDSEVAVEGTLSLIDCDLGNDVLNTTTAGAASIFGEGSLTMIVSLAALVVSVAGMGVTLSLKKKLEPATIADED